jgi:hypothetical protein
MLLAATFSLQSPLTSPPHVWSSVTDRVYSSNAAETTVRKTRIETSISGRYHIDHTPALLKSALFRGGLTTDTLNTLLAGESGANADDTSHYDYSPEKTFTKPAPVPDTMRAPHAHYSPLDSDDRDSGSEQLDLPQPRSLHRAYSNDHTESFADHCSDDEEHDYQQERGDRHQRIPMHDQRTILITNIAERTTHKDIAGVVRGGRLLDIFLRNDRSATVSFVEGAADFLSYVKRNDIYLHAKRVCIAEPPIGLSGWLLTHS